MDYATAGAAGALGSLAAEGVAPWLDGVHRGLIASGRLGRLVRQGLRGATMDPAAPEGLVSHPAYAEQLSRLAARCTTAESAVWALAAQDLVRACDELAAVSRSTHGHDGWVAVDMASRTTRDATAAVVEAVELARWVGRPNLLVVIAATDEGLTAIRECVGLGLGVVVAGVFSARRYRQVVDAYLDGLELRLATGRPLSRLAALAAVPVGLLDGAVDRQLADVLAADAPRGGPGTSAVPQLRGRTAQAVARQMYRAYEESMSGERWRALRAAGARPLRLLWTGSHVVGPRLARTRYVENLVCWGTAQAMSPAVLAETAHAMRLRGDTLTGTAEDAERHMAALADLGIAYDAMVPHLEDRWVAGRFDAWQRLLRVVEERLRPTGDAGRPASC